MAIILKANNLFNKEELQDLHDMYIKQLNDGLIILQGGIQFVHESTEAHELEIIREEDTADTKDQRHMAARQIAELLDENIKLRRERNTLEYRLQHLLLSDYIRSFDKKDIRTGEYVKDIKDADKNIVPVCLGGCSHSCSG